MATDIKSLQGEVVDEPSAVEMDVDALLTGLLRALIAEQTQIKKGDQ